jgi:hypothetical protein
MRELLRTRAMANNKNRDELDRVLTLRGHQITLRRALAEGLLVRYYLPPRQERGVTVQTAAEPGRGGDGRGPVTGTPPAPPEP